jgi:hypothetical protein
MHDQSRVSTSFILDDWNYSLASAKLGHCDGIFNDSCTFPVYSKSFLCWCYQVRSHVYV